MQAEYLYEGDVAKFTYNGGSTPGTVRYVYVIKADDDTLVHCWDFAKQAKRTFATDKMTNVLLVDAKFADVGNLPSCYTIEQLIDNFQQEGYYTYQKDDERVIAVNIPDVIPPINMTVYQTYNNKQEVYLNVGDKCVGFYVNGNELTIQGSYGDIQYKNPTVDQLKEVLSSVGL